MEVSEAQVVARKFLSAGRRGEISETDLASACVKEILTVSRSSYKQALRLAHRFAKHSRGQGSHLRMMAYRVLGQMSHQSGLHRDALTAYQSARVLARTNPLARASMDRMLIDIYMYLGKYREARRAARRASTVFRRLGKQADWHQTQVNYANLLHRLDRHADAARIYSAAARFFEKSNEPIAAARCNYNLANTSVQLFDVEGADHQYRQARELYDSAGHALGSCNVRYGQAWLAMLQGRFHIALLELEECERIYREAGDPRGEALCALDRAEIDLGLGLHSDALRNARSGERKFSKLGLRYELAKSSLYRSQAALALGRLKEARTARTRANRLFRLEGNTGFLGVAELVAADLLADEPSRSRILRKARSLFQKSQLRLWEAICDLKATTVPDQAEKALGQLKLNHAVNVVPHLYASWQTTLGDRYATKQKLEEARRSWQNAADRLDAVRAQLPPIELRSHFGRRIPSPHQRLIKAESCRNPRLAAIWSERQKTAGIWSPLPLHSLSDPARQRVGRSLDQLSHQVAFLMRQFPGGMGERGLSVRASRKGVAHLQAVIRDGLLSLEREGLSYSDSITQIDELFSKLSMRVPIVQFNVDDAAVTAFVHQHGQTKVRHFENGRCRIDSVLERWRFLLERELLSDYPGACIKTNAEESLWSELGQWLWQPMGVDTSATSVIVIPEGELANIPWQALIVDGLSLAERHNFILTPSTRHFAAAEGIDAKGSSIEIFRGAGDGLPRIDEEMQVLAKHGGPATTIHDRAHRGDWPFDSESHIWHYAGHAVMQEENPFYSFLALEDGPLFAVDFRLKRCQVGLVTLAACRTGEQVALPGEESSGLVRSLLEMGAKNVIAGNWPVSDESTALWMTTFYNRFMGGEELHQAARTAALTVRERYPSAFHWSAFSVYGAGPEGGAYASN